MDIKIVLIVLVLPMTLAAQPAPKVTPLLHAHAHNDYRHDRPLLDALDRGFTSVEADVHLVDGELLVAHDAHEVRPENTLGKLYLDPLRQRAQKYDGHIYPGKMRFILLIDLKTAAEPTYQRLHEVLSEYRDIMTSFEPEGRKERAVLAVISGNRPFELMAAQKVRYAGYDGRLTDLSSEVLADLMPMISDHWGRNFRWQGDGPMPAEEEKRLKDIVKACHDKGRIVRFWATPDRPLPQREAIWRELLKADVDLINTDDLDGLREFLLKNGR